ncbi:FHAD1 protein, partial [Steatornis caripensis]|nr:FHAD1 protein [Steatornis caripensis]
REEELQTVQEENELRGRKLQEEIVEYKEQIKQHSLTIVALEERLLEVKQQQKTLEEENAALVEKMEGRCAQAPCEGSLKGIERFALIFHRKFREELVAAQQALLSKEAVIAGLTRELAETRARMSDMRGELSEKQKVELERNQSRVEGQERELTLLREKLSQMSSLVEKKHGALQAAAEELRYVLLGPEALHKLLYRFPAAGGTEISPWEQKAGSRGENQLGCFLQGLALDLADLGAKCRGLRHEETIRRQKEGLAELRERIKMLEKSQSSAVAKKDLEPLVVLTKDLPEKTVQKAALEKELAPASGTKLKAGKVPGHVPNGGSHGAADGSVSLEMADGTDLSENTYLDVIGALGSLMKVKELSALRPLKHLPREEREKVGLQTQKGLELLYQKIRNLQSRLERKEEMLKDYEATAERLRLSQESLRRCQEEKSELEDKAYKEAEEKALLKEALERMQLQLNQEKKLLRVAQLHQV